MAYTNGSVENFAVVDLVTLGGAIAATKFSEMGLKEGLKAFGKTALIDFAGNTAACGVGALGETFDWPVPITMMLSLAAGITVSISGNKLLFKNADGIEIGSKTLSDDDLKIVEQTIEGENYSNLTEVVSAKEAEVYLHFLESGSTEGMTESELKAVQKIEELIKSNKIDYDGILKIRNETVKSDVEVVRKTTEDSVEDVGKSAAEDAGKVVETSYGGSSGNISELLENRPELTGTNREKLLSMVQDTKLAAYINEVYRPGASVGDGGTADKLIMEFYEGSSRHLPKAKERLVGINRIIDSGKLGLNDLDIAEALRDDLEYAIDLFK